MHMQPVSSSRIREVGWEDNTLYIRFHNGALYAYYEVSRDKYLSFLNSPSLGSELSRLDKAHRYKPL